MLSSGSGKLLAFGLCLPLDLVSVVLDTVGSVLGTTSGSVGLASDSVSLGVPGGAFRLSGEELRRWDTISKSLRL